MDLSTQDLSATEDRAGKGKPLSNLNRRNAVILVTTAVSSLLYYFLGGWGFERATSEVFGGARLFSSSLYFGVWVHFLTAPLFLALPAILVIKFVLKEELAAFGLSAGNARAGFIFLAVIAIPMVIGSYFTSLNTEMDTYYDYMLAPGWGTPFALAFHGASFLLWVFGWEFLYRGVIFLGMRSSCTSTWIPLVLSAICGVSMLLGKPLMLAGAWLATTVLFAYPVRRANSIYYTIIVAWTSGFLNDLFEIIRLRVQYPGS